MQRISVKKDLEPIVARINRMTNSPQESYVRGEDGRLRAQIGNYHLSQAYGGCALHQMQTEGGGVRDVFGVGHMPARELYGRLCSYIEGLYDALGD